MVVFFSLLLFFGAAVQIEKDHASLHPGERLQVTIVADQPAAFFDCVEAVEGQKRYGSFELESYTLVDPTRLELILRPLKLGTLLFAPGLLTLQDGSTASIPSFEIECQRVFPASQFMPPMPVRPEEAIQLNDELRARMQQDTTASATLLLQKKERRGKIWTSIFCLLFGGAALLGALFFLNRYRHRKRNAIVEKRHWQKELMARQSADELALFLREFAMYRKSEALQELIQRLDEDRFSGKSINREQLFEYSQKAAQIITLYEVR